MPLPEATQQHCNITIPIPIMEDYHDVIKLVGQSYDEPLDHIISAVARHNDQALDIAAAFRALRDGVRLRNTSIRAPESGAPAVDADEVSSLTAVDMRIERLGRALIDRLRPKITLRSHATTTATTVLCVAELCIMIAEYLHPQDVFAFEQVNRTTLAILRSSPAMQQHLHLKADPEAHFSTHLIYPVWPKTPGLPWTPVTGSWVLPGDPDDTLGVPDHVQLRVIANTGSHRAPRAGPRCRSMLLCQPPIYEIQVRPNCCSRYSNEGPRGGGEWPILRSETGLTVGDILDAHEETVKAHAHCPWARARCHDENRLVNSKVIFDVRPKIKSDDPIMASYWQGVARREKVRQHNARMERYVAAKMQGQYDHPYPFGLDLLTLLIPAHQNGKPIPNLEEFERPA